MGNIYSSRKDSAYIVGGEVNFDQFQIIRAIGKGSFGKVCIVRKKDTKKMLAMKYMNKRECIADNAVHLVIQEMRILLTLSHPFLVNLWFTFHDAEDMFMVVELYTGGDLRYHIQRRVHFDMKDVKLYICELALALDYLCKKCIVHRDVKPDNILLDEKGHVHLTDFNVATYVTDEKLLTSMTGTKPYMAPEIFACALQKPHGYRFAVDWWALGVTAYEMLREKRPFDINYNIGVKEVMELFESMPVHYPSHWAAGMTSVLKELLHQDWHLRISSAEQLNKHWYYSGDNFNDIQNKTVAPSFVPSKDQLNCDPTYELEEMIIETNPLHKKKKRLAKQQLKDNSSPSLLKDPIQDMLDKIDKEFPIYNREREKLLWEDGPVDTRIISHTRSSPIDPGILEDEATSVDYETSDHCQMRPFLPLQTTSDLNHSNVSELPLMQDVDQEQGVQQTQSMHRVQDMHKEQDVQWVQAVKQVQDLHQAQEVRQVQDVHQVQDVNKMQDLHQIQNVDQEQDVQQMQEVPQTQDVQQMLQDISIHFRARGISKVSTIKEPSVTGESVTLSNYHCLCSSKENLFLNEANKPTDSCFCFDSSRQDADEQTSYKMEDTQSESLVMSVGEREEDSRKIQGYREQNSEEILGHILQDSGERNEHIQMDSENSKVTNELLKADSEDDSEETLEFSLEGSVESNRYSTQDSESISLESISLEYSSQHNNVSQGDSTQDSKESQGHSVQDSEESQESIQNFEESILGYNEQNFEEILGHSEQDCGGETRGEGGEEIYRMGRGIGGEFNKEEGVEGKDGEEKEETIIGEESGDGEEGRAERENMKKEEVEGEKEEGESK